MNKKFVGLVPAALALALVAGCFDEPVSAEKTVPANARLYFQDKGLKDLSTVASLIQPEVVDFINLDRNQLEVLPPEIATLEKLKWLRLNDNRLSTLPDLSKLVKLRLVLLRNNQLKTVPEALKDLPALEDLDLSGNPIAEVPLWLAQRKGLKSLALNGTKITKLPDDLSAWKSLQSLQLGDLQLSAEEMRRIRDALRDPDKKVDDVAIVF